MPTKAKRRKAKPAKKTPAKKTPAKRKLAGKKPAARTKAAAPKAKSTSPTRFAHPFYTTTPVAQRKPVAQHGSRLLTHIQGTLQKVPLVQGTGVMQLADVIGATGASEIAAAGSIQFHATGDTGKGPGTPQEDVAIVMAQDYDIGNAGKSPAFFFHLGDVIYGPGKDNAYRGEFYEPYMHYPGKIIAIPGNHDGEVFPSSDATSLKAFLANFCAPSQAVPAIAGSIFRQTMNQPGVYWLLDTPFVQIIGLYANAAENPGFISGQIPGSAQKTWLVNTLKQIASDRASGKRKALVMATHHPPFTAGGHSPSIEMLADLDDACTQAKLMPDLFLSGHAHSYQRYHRQLTFLGKKMTIPYIVAGTGGINDQAVPAAAGQVTGDHVFVKSLHGYGYLLVIADATTIKVKMIAVSGANRSDFDAVTVNLATGTVQ